MSGGSIITYHTGIQGAHLLRRDMKPTTYGEMSIKLRSGPTNSIQVLLMAAKSSLSYASATSLAQ